MKDEDTIRHKWVNLQKKNINFISENLQKVSSHYHLSRIVRQSNFGHVRPEKIQISLRIRSPIRIFTGCISDGQIRCICHEKKFFGPASNQAFSSHAKPLARSQFFRWSFRCALPTWANSTGSGETVRMRKFTSRKHAYIILTPLSPTFI